MKTNMERINKRRIDFRGGIMPLRIAEKENCIWAVNGCYNCPFHEFTKNISGLSNCNHPEGIRKDFLASERRIPVWCPLPREETKAKCKCKKRHTPESTISLFVVDIDPNCPIYGIVPTKKET